MLLNIHIEIDFTFLLLLFFFWLQCCNAKHEKYLNARVHCNDTSLINISFFLEKKKKKNQIVLISVLGRRFLWPSQMHLKILFNLVLARMRAWLAKATLYFNIMYIRTSSNWSTKQLFGQLCLPLVCA